MTDTTQAVVDAVDTQPKAGSEANDARTGDDLDALLDQFKQQTAPAPTPPPAPAAAPTPELKDLEARFQAVEGVAKQLSDQKFKSDITQTVKNVRGEIPADVIPDDVVEAWLDAQARKDPRLQKAWLERDNSPEQFNRITAELGKKFAKNFAKMPDRAATEDREAVTAAVRGASTKAPADPPPNYANSSNTDFRKDVQAKYGFDPGV
jgi:hypothetical protein